MSGARAGQDSSTSTATAWPAAAHRGGCGAEVCQQSLRVPAAIDLTVAVGSSDVGSM